MRKLESKNHGAIFQRRLHDRRSMKHFDLLPHCDGQADEHTDGRIPNTVLGKARYADC